MGNVVRQVFMSVLCFAPVVLVGFVIIRKDRALRKRSKVPFRELRRRPAGESLRLKLVALDDRALNWILALLALPGSLGLIGGIIPSPGLAFTALIFTLSLVWSVGFGWKFYCLIRERANYQLGFNGERFVGEELTRLVAQGFEIYHDLPFDSFNIDHVLVGPAGVFAVETKTRRKPLSESGEKEYRVEFDGFRLHWPMQMGVDAYGIEQAANNARTLAQWLSGAVGESVTVTPILTLPGWMVERKAPSKAVHIVNPKEIIKVCVSKQPRIDENLMRRICYQLDQKCKLEF